MRILICDDCQDQLNCIVKNVQSYALTQPQYNFEVLPFSNALDLLNTIKGVGDVDIALLDVCMPGMSGTELAKELLLQGNKAVDIVFLTTSAEFAVEAFALHATDYLLKPFSQMRFNEMLDRILNKRNNYRFIPIFYGGDVYRINVFDLLYVEASNNDKHLHLVSGECISMRITMPKLYELLSVATGLVEIGVSFIVNFRHVRSIFATTLLLDDGTVIPVPRRLRATLQKEYFDFYTKEALVR